MPLLESPSMIACLVCGNVYEDGTSSPPGAWSRQERGGCRACADFSGGNHRAHPAAAVAASAAAGWSRPSCSISGPQRS